MFPDVSLVRVNLWACIWWEEKVGTTRKLRKKAMTRKKTFTKENQCLGGGGSYSTNVHKGRLWLEVQPLTVLYTIFHEKGTPFVYLLFTNGTPFTLFASLLTAVNAVF